MDNQPPADPMGILLNKPGQLAPMPYIVTMQLQFRVDASSKDKAIQAVHRGINIILPLTPMLLSQGIDAQPMTREVMAELAELAKAQGVNLG